MTAERPSDDAVYEAVAEMAEGAREEAQADFWSYYWPRRVAPVIIVLALLFGGLSAFAVVNLYGRQNATDAAVTSLRQQAESSKAQGDQANNELQARGQAPVPIPTPGTAPDTDVIVASAAAKVLASLPTSTVAPAALGRAVADYIAANPVAPAQPSPLQISSALAGYLAANPPAAGRQGEEGQPGATGQPGAPGQSVQGPPGPEGQQGPEGPAGPPPSTEDIQSAFLAYIKDHPDALCPNGGSFAQLRVRLSDGGAADTFTCVVATYPASSIVRLPGN